MAKKAKSRAPELVLVMKNGEKFTITGEDGRYWYCGETRFRKSNEDILTVEEAGRKEDALDAETVETADVPEQPENEEERAEV